MHPTSSLALFPSLPQTQCVTAGTSLLWDTTAHETTHSIGPEFQKRCLEVTILVRVPRSNTYAIRTTFCSPEDLAQDFSDPHMKDVIERQSKR